MRSTLWRPNPVTDNPAGSPASPRTPSATQKAALSVALAVAAALAGAAARPVALPGALGALWGWSLALPARAAAAQPDSPEPILRVRGEATLTVRPDVAVIWLGVISRADSAQQAMARTARTARQVLDAVERLGVSAREVKTRGLQLAPLFRSDDKAGAERPIGYEARYDLEITLRDMELVGAVVDEAVQAGANQVQGIRFSVRDLQAVQQEVLRQAVADGLRRAQTLAEAAGVRLGALRSVEDVQLSGPPMLASPTALAGRLSAAVPIAPGELTLQASVLLTFQLREPLASAS